MDIVTDVKQKNKRYLAHELTTRINSVKLYRQTRDMDFVLRRYHISKASLMRWNKRYDGTKSLMDQSHSPHSRHPKAYTEEKLGWIRNYHRRNPNISTCALYGKLLQGKGYSRHTGTMVSFLEMPSYPSQPYDRQKPSSRVSAEKMAPQRISRLQ